MLACRSRAPEGLIVVGYPSQKRQLCCLNRRPRGKPIQCSAERFSKVVPLQIPVSVSGLSPGTIVNLNGVKISADSPQISIGGLGWQNHYETIWPEDQRKTFGYAVDRKEYEKIRSQPPHLHIELAFSEYQEADARSLHIPAGSFAAGTLGTCRVSSFERRRGSMKMASIM